MIKTLELTNWRTHSSTSIGFGLGTNVIVGQMGAGKSSVVNAICYALFGSIPAVKNRQLSLKEIIMNRPNQTQEAIVRLGFTAENAEYVVERTIRLDGATEANLYKEGRLVSGPKQKDVNEKLEKLFGISYDLFSRAVYSEQNELDYFLKISPSERKKKFDELLEIELYENARKNSVSVSNELNKQSKQSLELIESQKKFVSVEEEQQYLSQKQTLEKELIELNSKIISVKELVESTQKKVDLLEHKEKEFRDKEREIFGAKQRVSILEKDVQKFVGINLVEIQNTIKNIESELVTIDLDIKELEKKSLETDKLERAEAENEGALVYRKKQLTSEITELETLQGNCPKCRQTLNETHRQEILSPLKKELTELLEKIAKVLEKKSSLQTESKEIKKIIIAKRSLVDDKKTELSRQKNIEKGVLELEEKKKDYEKTKALIPSLESQLTSILFNPQELTQMRNELSTQKSNLQVTNQEIYTKKQFIFEKQTAIDKLLKQRKEIEKQIEQCIKLDKTSKEMSVFANCIASTQSELRENLLDRTNNAMTELWPLLYPYKDFTDAKLSSTDDGYDVSVKASNGWVKAEGILSGGERSAAALCIRMAFALVLTKKLSMIILDEPTHNLDRNAVEKLSAVLREEMPKLVEQTFIITHDKNFESASSEKGRTYFLSRSKAEDGPTQVEMIEKTN